MSAAQVFEHVGAFWATHGLLGLLSAPTLARHLWIVNKATQERGARFSALYFSSLIEYIRREVAKSPSPVKDVNQYLTDVIPTVEASAM